MNSIFSIGSIVVGIILIVYGLSSADSISSSLSRFFTGSPTDKSIWLMISGILAVAVGLTTFLRQPSDRS